MGRKLNIAIISIIVIVILAYTILNIYADFLWFNSLGYSSVFWTSFTAQISLALITGFVFLVVSYLSLKYMRNKVLTVRKGANKKKINDPIPLFKIGMIVLILIASYVVGSYFGGVGWDVVLKNSAGNTFGIADPVFGNDISFYVFTLPFYNLILTYILSLVGFSMFLIIATYLVYFKLFGVDRFGLNGLKPLWKRIYPHIGLIFILAAIFIYLSRFDLLFSDNEVLFGAGYTDLNVRLPLTMIMSVVSALIGISLFASIFKQTKIPAYLFGLLILISIIGMVASVATESLVVKPNQFDMEKPFIERTIEFTRKAYNLDSIEERPFTVGNTLEIEDIENNKETIENIRLWDWRPLKKTFNQLQLFRTYYDFPDVDIDRYKINGMYKQVMISPRELDTNQLPSSADTWVNRHLVYTHGYGVVMNPVDKITERGLPEFYIKDIPPESPYFQLTRPEIYYGSKSNDFVIVNGNTEELDYPKGDQNIYTRYQGTGGVSISDALAKLAFAVKFGSIELLLSGSLTENSRIMMNRDIWYRVRLLAPFLAYDSDPYIVIDEGRLFWIYDAYTTTTRYPYSEPVWVDYNTNYIRNSVKVVIDAYNGDTTFYVVDEDPIIKTYSNIFPSLFKDISQMPSGIKQHIRYPDDLLLTQAWSYAKYHMKDPRVFYNKEDQWRVPNEKYRGFDQQMMPYFVIMRLPGETEEKFITILPFVPVGKENMIGWLVANSDGDDYGKLAIYQFSKQTLVYGPMQIESRIDQDTEISQSITLWDQAGSEVIRGNLLVIPIEDSILYIEPLYLQASSASSVPELKRVIVTFGDDIEMAETLDKALEKLFGKSTAQPAVNGTATGTPISTTQEELITEANRHYQNALDAQRAGDWATYGDEIRKLGEALNRLEK